MDASASNRLFRRDSNCVTCPNTLPPCNCTQHEMCQEISRSCSQCATRTCIPNQPPQSTSTAVSSGSKVSSSSNVGAIAGGVIGGCVALALLGFLIWWFVIRKRRQEQEEEKSNFGGNMQARRSVASVASTALTRTSNVIQIAYIPGVTNRSPPDSPRTLVPPIPPIPSAYPSNSSSPAFAEEQHFFMPGDIRDSRYSEMSGARHSIATSLARSSVATTIYGANAVASPISAQKAFGGRAAMVSVRSGSTTPGDSGSPNVAEAPMVPPFPNAQLSHVGMGNSSIIARSVVARPVNVRRPSKKVPVVSEETKEPNQPTEPPSSAASKPATKNDDNSPSAQMGPFSDMRPTLIVSDLPSVDGAVSSARNSRIGSINSNHRQRSSVGSSRLYQEAPTNMPNLSTAKDSSTERSESPFSDVHAVKE